MKRYLALIRAINVGGNNQIRMDDLRALFESIGFASVTTHIQTGNVFFESDKDVGAIVTLAEKALKRALGSEMTVIIRNPAQMSAIVRNAPFTDEELSDSFKRYIIFLKDTPAAKRAEALLARRGGYEHYHVIGTEVYMALRVDGTRLPSANLVEKVLNVRGTARNWAVTQKLSALLTKKVAKK